MKNLIFTLLLLPTFLLSQIPMEDLQYVDAVRLKFSEHAKTFGNLSAYQTAEDKETAYYYSLAANTAFLHADYLNMFFALMITLQDEGLNAVIKIRLEQVVENIDKNLKILPTIKSKTLENKGVLFQEDSLKLRDRLQNIHHKM